MYVIRKNNAEVNTSLSDNTNRKNNNKKSQKTNIVNRRQRQKRIMIYYSEVLQRQLQYYAVLHKRSINYIFCTALQRFFRQELNYQNRDNILPYLSSITVGQFWDDSDTCFSKKVRCNIRVPVKLFLSLQKQKEYLNISREAFFSKIFCIGAKMYNKNDSFSDNKDDVK